MNPDPALPYGPISCEIDMLALREMDMKSLCDLRKTFNSINEILVALRERSIFASEDGENYNTAGHVLVGISDFLLSYEQAAVNVAKDRPAKSSDDARYRAWTIVGFEADCLDELAAVAAKAAEGARAEIVAVRQETVARRAALKGL